MATATTATAPTSANWWDAIVAQATSSGARIFETASEGANALIQKKINDKIGVVTTLPEDQQRYYDVTGSGSYQRQNQTATGMDWNGVPLNQQGYMQPLSIQNPTVQTGLVVAGLLLASLMAYKLLK